MHQHPLADKHPLADTHPQDVTDQSGPGQDFNNNRIMDFQKVQESAGQDGVWVHAVA